MQLPRQSDPPMLLLSSEIDGDCVALSRHAVFKKLKLSSREGVQAVHPAEICLFSRIRDWRGVHSEFCIQNGEFSRLLPVGFLEGAEEYCSEKETRTKYMVVAVKVGDNSFETAEVLEYESAAADVMYVFKQGERIGEIFVREWSSFLGAKCPAIYQVNLNGIKFGEIRRPTVLRASQGLSIDRTENSSLRIKLYNSTSFLEFLSYAFFPLRIAKGCFDWMNGRGFLRAKCDFIIAGEDSETLSNDEAWFYFVVTCMFRFIEFGFDFTDSE